MLSHTFLGTNDSERARTFYAPIMAALGWQERVSPHLPHLAIWKPAGASRPLFVLGPPFDGGMADAGNGQMVALLAKDRDTVEQVYAMALAAGASCEGPPGLRPQYHAHYYGAYFRDPDGHKLCIVCHDAIERDVDV